MARYAQRLASVTCIALLLSVATAKYAHCQDLGSPVRSETSQAAGVIRVGGNVMVIRPGEQVTPAQAAALQQVLSTGHQTLALGTGGVSVGGRVNLGRDMTASLSSLSIPRNVTALGDFAHIGALEIAGTLFNAGALYAYSTNPNLSNATISGASIINGTGALISSVLPSSLGIQNAIQELDLTFLSNNITNHGTISSSRDINVIGSGGASSTLSIAGSDGVWSARALNLTNLNGSIDAQLGNVNAIVATTGAEAHVVASTPNLKLGDICMTGDPTYYNTNGDIHITGNITVAENLSIIASRDLMAFSKTTIRATDGVNGKNIILVAGANLTSLSGSQTSTVGPVPGSFPGSGSVRLNGASPTGGDIYFTSGSLIDTHGASANGAGGNIVVAAFGTSSSSGGGEINLTGVNLVTSGAGTGTGGNVSIIGGGTLGFPIVVGNITAKGGTSGGAGGSVAVSAAQPALSDGQPMIFAANGSLTSSNYLIADSSSHAVGGNVTIGNVDTSGGGSTTVGQPGDVILSANSKLTVAGYILALAGSSTSGIDNSRGDISLTGNTVAINGVSGKGFSVEGGRSISIAAQGLSMNSFLPDFDLGSAATYVLPYTISPFIVGSSSSNGAAGGLTTGPSGSITINGSANLGPISSGSFASTGASTSIVQGGQLVPVDLDSATAAQGVAVYQALTYKQGIVLDSTGIATGGSVYMPESMAPTGGYAKLSIPAHVSVSAATDSAPLVVHGPVTIDGDLGFGTTGRLIADGTIRVNSGGTISGSGSIGSSLLLSTSPTSNADIEIAGQVTGSVVATLKTNNTGNILTINAGRLSVAQLTLVTATGSAIVGLTGNPTVGFQTQGGSITLGASQSSITLKGGSNAGSGSLNISIHNIVLPPGVICACSNNIGSLSTSGTGSIIANGGISILVDPNGTVTANNTLISKGLPTSGVTLGGTQVTANTDTDRLSIAQGSAVTITEQDSVVLGNVSSSILKLTAGGSITGGGTVSATTRASVTSTGGGIGSPGSPVTINTPTLTVNTVGDMFIADNNASVQLAALSKTGVVGYTGSGALSTFVDSLNGDSINHVTGSSVSAQFGTLGTAQFKATGATGSASLIATGSLQPTSLVVTANTVNLTAPTIGSAASRFVIGTPNLNVSAAGDVYIRNSNSGGTTFSGTSTGGVIDFASSSNVTVGSSALSNGIAGNFVRLSANSITGAPLITSKGSSGAGVNITATAGNIDVNTDADAITLNGPAGVVAHEVDNVVLVGSSTAGGSGLRIIAGGNIDAAAGSSITASSVTLGTTSGAIGSADSPVIVDTPLLEMFSHGDAFANNISNASGFAARSESGDIKFSTPGSLYTVSDSISGVDLHGVQGQNVTLQVGSLLSGSAVYATTANVTATSGDIAGGITIEGNAILAAPNGSIGGGSAANPSYVALSAPTVIASAGNDILLSNFSAASVLSASAGKTFIYDANGAAVTTGTSVLAGNGISAGTDVTIKDAGSIAIDSPITAGTGSINLSTAATADGGIGGPGVLTAKGHATSAVILSAGAGGINVKTDADAITANAVGSVSISEVDSVNLLGDNTAGGNGFSLTSGGSVQLGAITANAIDIHAGQSIDVQSPVTASSGFLKLAANSLRIDNILSGKFINITLSGSSPSLTGTGTIQSQLSVISSDSGNSPNDLVFDNAHLTTIGDTTFISGAPNQIALNGGTTISPQGPLTFVVGAGGLNGNIGGIDGAFTVISIGNSPGTISNPSGDVVLNAPLTYLGQDLAILAAGSIRGTKAGSINLSSRTGQGGNLLMVAGYKFDVVGGTPGYPSPEQAGTYYADSGDVSVSGGDIQLSNWTIKTSSSTTSFSPVGGAFVAPRGGNVLAVAHGGAVNAGVVSLGSITTSADASLGFGGAVKLIGQGGVSTGAINTKGAIGGAVDIIAAEPLISGGFIKITHGQMYGGGMFTAADPHLSPAAGAAIDVRGSITTSGSTKNAGAVRLIADQQISITGGILANGVRSGGSAASGADVSLDSVYSSIKIGRTGVNTSGASASHGIAGGAGDVSLSAASYITSGSIKAIGGNNSGGGAAGSGGDVLIRTANFGHAMIGGFIDTHGGSANARNGGPGANGGDGGDVAIDVGTIAITSSTRGNSIVATGGAKGKGGVNDGAPGDVAITTRAIQQLPKNFDLTSAIRNIALRPGGEITFGAASPVNGLSGGIAAGTKVSSITNLGGAVKGLYTTVGTTSFGNISLTVLGDNSSSFDASTGKRVMVTPAEAVVAYQTDRSEQPTITVNSKGQATGGSVTVDEVDTNGTAFSAFKVPALVELKVTGARPMLMLPATAKLEGELKFTTSDSNAFIDFGAGSFVNNGKIDALATKTLILSGTASSWTNSGELVAHDVAIARSTASAFTFVTKGTTKVDGFLLFHSNLSSAVALTGDKLIPADYDAPIKFGALPMPSMYTANSEAIAANAGQPRALKIAFMQTDADGRAIPGVIEQASGSPFIAKSLTITGASLAFGNGLQLVTSGGNMTFRATSGDMQFGGNNTFTADGGSITALAKGTVFGGVDNTFTATATPRGAYSGGVEIGSGTTTSLLSASFSKPAGTVPTTSLGHSGVSVTRASGAVVVNASEPTGTIDLARTQPSALNLNGGVIVFDVKGAAAKVLFDSLTVNVQAPRPVADLELTGDVVIDTADDTIEDEMLTHRLRD